MDPMAVMADVLVRHCSVIEMTLADFSDAEMLVRPVEGANHAIWQLGHLATSTAYYASGVPGANVPAQPKEWGELFGKKGVGIDDAKAFPSKGELLKALKGATEAMAEAVKKLKPEQLDGPAPEGIRGFAPTIGVLIGITAPHCMMHVGQFQVIRRKLGKKILF